MSRIVSQIFLRREDKSSPDILLTNGQGVFVGRNELTKIKDKRLSRNHLKLTAIYGHRSVRVDHLGNNNSVLNGSAAKKGDFKILKEGDTIQLLEGKYVYVLRYQYKEERAKNFTTSASTMSSTSTANGKSGAEPERMIGHWSNGLLQAMNDPNLIVDEDDQVVVIKDRFPKAKHHFLILPRNKINKLCDVQRNDLPLMRHIHDKGLELAKKYPESEFQMGYHAVPSMNLLHMHLISTDFSSDSLKTKRHWNSFTTDYFISSQSVLERLEKDGFIEEASAEEGKAFLSQKLVCHKCSYEPKNLPDLKKHLTTHFSKK